MSLSVSPGSSPSSAELLRQLRAGDHRPLDDLYRNHRAAFINWAAYRFPRLDAGALADAFQEAVVVFYENVISGRLSELTVQPHTYVFRIGERFCRENEKKSGPTIKILPLSAIKGEIDELLPLNLPPEAIDHLPTDPLGLTADQFVGNTYQARIGRALRQLTADCQRLLIAFYYADHEVSIAELSAELGHSNTATTSARKSQCMSRLRAILFASS